MAEPSYWQQLDQIVADHKAGRRIGDAQQGTLPMKGALKGPRTPLAEVEISIITKLQGHVTFPPATGPKRFIRELTTNSKLSDSGRQYLAWIAHRFRRQWAATQEESEWIVKWKTY